MICSRLTHQHERSVSFLHISVSQTENVFVLLYVVLPVYQKSTPSPLAVVSSVLKHYFIRFIFQKTSSPHCGSARLPSPLAARLPGATVWPALSLRSFLLWADILQELRGAERRGTVLTLCTERVCSAVLSCEKDSLGMTHWLLECCLGVQLPG